MYSFILLLYAYFTRTFLGVRVCVCVYRLTGLVECVEQSDGLRRDGAWEHGVLQQRAAGEAVLHEAPHVCVLMHVGAAQARTRGRQERPVRPLVLAAVQVREMHPARASHDARLPV
jgi:hypothetical protein